MRGILQRLTSSRGRRGSWSENGMTNEEKKDSWTENCWNIFRFSVNKKFFLISHPHSDSEDFFPIFHIINFKFIPMPPLVRTHIFFGVSLMNFNKISVDKNLAHATHKIRKCNRIK